MERDGVLAHGASQFLQESLMVRGDEYYMAVCNQTGMIAIYNENKNIFLSPMSDGPLKFNHNNDGTMNIDTVSKHGRSFSIIRVPYAFKLLVQELQTINTQIRVITDENIDQLTSMSFSSNIIKLKGIEDMPLKTKKVLSDVKTAESNMDADKKHLFGAFIKNTDELMLDDNANTTTNITSYSIAKRMTTDIIDAILNELDVDLDMDEDHSSIIRRMNIVDVSPGLGVHMMAFLQKFGHVDAIEPNPISVKILNHNVGVYSKENSIPHDRFQVYQGNYVDVIANDYIKKDIIFIEPTYAAASSVYETLMTVDGKPIEDVVKNMLALFPFVIVKLPLNYKELFEYDMDNAIANANNIDIRPIFRQNYSKTKVAVYHNEALHEAFLLDKMLMTDKDVDEKEKEGEGVINVYARMNAEKMGWYLNKDMSDGLVFGSIILDENGKETDRWAVNERDGRYPNIPVIGWKSAELVYDDGSGKSIPTDIVIERLRDNFVEGNWNKVVSMIKSGTDYTPNTPTRIDENGAVYVKRLSNEHIPAQRDNYIPYSPNVSNNVSPYAAADYALAKPAASEPELLQSVSKQLSDVQNKMNTYVASSTMAAKGTAQNVMTSAQGAMNIAKDTAQSAIQGAMTSAQGAITSAQGAITSAKDTAANVADKVADSIMDVVEEGKPITSVLTDIVSGDKDNDKDKDKDTQKSNNNSNVKTIKI